MCVARLCPALPCWWGHREGRARHPSTPHAAPHGHHAAGTTWTRHHSCQVSRGECKVNETHTKALPNPSYIHPKNQ